MPHDRYVLDHATEAWTTDPIGGAAIDFVLNARTTITVSPAGETMPTNPCPDDYNYDARESERLNPQPRERVLRSTRAPTENVDAHRDFDGFDVDEELARLRLALNDGSMVASAFIREAFANIDAWLVREGTSPKGWRYSPRVEVPLRDPMPCLYSDTERLFATATDLAETEWADETLRLRAIVFLARTAQRMVENRDAFEANRENAERQAEREELLFNAQRESDKRTAEYDLAMARAQEKVNRMHEEYTRVEQQRESDRAEYARELKRIAQEHATTARVPKRRRGK